MENTNLEKAIKCVYKITNLNTKQVYIGSALNSQVRKQQHFTMLKNNTHFNWKMQLDYNQGHKFEFEIIYDCEKLNRGAVYDLEQGFINLQKYKYNLSKYTSSRNSEGRIVNRDRRKKSKVFKSKYENTKNIYA
jgi:hypothetical protein